MYTVEVNKIAAGVYKLTVHGKTTTEHHVTVRPDYVQQLTHGKINEDVLVRASFEFLLAHESNTSILRSFDLGVITDYFADYEATIKKML